MYFPFHYIDHILPYKVGNDISLLFSNFLTNFVKFELTHFSYLNFFIILVYFLDCTVVFSYSFPPIILFLFLYIHFIVHTVLFSPIIICDIYILCENLYQNYCNLVLYFISLLFEHPSNDLFNVFPGLPLQVVCLLCTVASTVTPSPAPASSSVIQTRFCLSCRIVNYCAVSVSFHS